MKSSFLNSDKPFMTTMVQAETAERVIELMELSKREGADAFGVQACKLKPEFQKPEYYRQIFGHADGLPVYATNYRYGYNEAKTDEELAEGLLVLADCGATLCDVVGDYFCRDQDELTMNPEAVRRQMELIDKLHDKGAEVLMSSHTFKFRSAERVIEMALEQERRGADIVKIVTGAENLEQQMENLRITQLLKKELKVPYLFLSCEECHLHRRIGPFLGCCMWLCVYEYDELATPAQPLLQKIRNIRDNFL